MTSTLVSTLVALVILSTFIPSSHADCSWLTVSQDAFYITLFSGDSVSQYPPAQTDWRKIRLASTPSAFDTQVLVDTSDFTFSTSTGISSGHDVTQLPFGAAYGCVGGPGTSIVDLIDTPFAVQGGAAQFTSGGWMNFATIECVSENKRCSLNCGGFCGYCGPVAVPSEEVNREGGAYLWLDVVDAEAYSSCVNLYLGQPSLGFKNIALLKPVSLSPNSAGDGFSTALVDGATDDTNWNVSPHWDSEDLFQCSTAFATIDLGYQSLLSSITVWQVYSDSRRYCGQKLEVSNVPDFEGEQTVVVDNGSDFGSEQKNIGSVYGEHVGVYRYVRFTSGRSSMGSGIEMVEVQVMGRELKDADVTMAKQMTQLLQGPQKYLLHSLWQSSPQ